MRRWPAQGFLRDFSGGKNQFQGNEGKQHESDLAPASSGLKTAEPWLAKSARCLTSRYQIKVCMLSTLDSLGCFSRTLLIGCRTVGTQGCAFIWISLSKHAQTIAFQNVFRQTAPKAPAFARTLPLRPPSQTRKVHSAQ